MRQLPALFSTPMVQAILENRKTMTRRTRGLERVNKCPYEWTITSDTTNKGILFFNKSGFSERMKPQYQVGDQIWIKEEYYASGYWVTTGEKTKTGKPEKMFVDNTLNVIDQTYFYFDNKPDSFRIDRNTVRGSWFKRSSLFMPKKAARIWLECTGVRCERLFDISEQDAIAEGVESIEHPDFVKYKQYEENTFHLKYPHHSFLSLWRKINGPESCTSNPWVFVYEFKRIEKP